MIPLRAISIPIAVALLLLAISAAQATRGPAPTLTNIDCVKVERGVREFGLRGAVIEAIRRGFPFTLIEYALRECGFTPPSRHSIVN